LRKARPATIWRQALAIILAVWFLVFSLNVVFPVTPTGVQCPTASIQTVACGQFDCCGNLVGKATRAPRPGEKGFVQCRCAEKRAVQQKLAASPKSQLYLASDLPVASAYREISTETFAWPLASLRSLNAAPPVRPPDCA